MAQPYFETPNVGLEPSFAEPGIAGQAENAPTYELEDEPTFEAHVAIIGLQLHKKVVAASRRKEALSVDYAVAQGNFD